MSADFSRAAAALGQALHEHADRDGLTGVRRAVFLDRGRHAVGEQCPTESPSDPHLYWCRWPEDKCRRQGRPHPGAFPREDSHEAADVA